MYGNKSPMPAPIGVVITEGDFQGLAVLRSLARQGIPTIVIDHEPCITRYSRFHRKFVRSPPPSDAEAYVQFLIDLCRREHLQDWIVFPISDEIVYVLSRYKDLLEGHYRIPIPSWEIIQNVYIKEKTYQLAEKLGIAIPRTYYPKTEAELRALDLPFPAVVKPSIRDHFYSQVKTKAFRVDTPEALLRTYRRVCEVIDASEVLVQEFIPGGPQHLYSCCPFFKDGHIVASVTARRRRQHPMDFGHASTFVELVEIPALPQIAADFLSTIGYYGIAEVEFMQDTQTGVYKLIEVNPRFWGWHSLAIAAGVDFPYLWYQDMRGQTLQATVTRTDLKWVRLLTDVPTVLLELVKGRMSLQNYLTSMRGATTFAVLSRRDPLPFVAEVAMVPYLWMKRGF
jgi:predicted ATP-grasp superfamily ATP-dependent carboligase